MVVADGSDPLEVERAVRLCLKGAWKWPERAADGRSWEAWTEGPEALALAEHVLAVGRWARLGAHREIIVADGEVKGGLLGIFSEEGTPAAPDALWKRLHRALAEGRMPGRLATLCAVNAVTFQLGTLTALQSAYFLEWQARWKSDTKSDDDRTVRRFLSTCGPFLQQLSTLLRSHEPATAPRFSIC